jgi:hypothetical protein
MSKLTAALVLATTLLTGCIGDDLAAPAPAANPCAAWCESYYQCSTGGGDLEVLNNCRAVAAVDCHPVGDPAACEELQLQLTCTDGIIYDTDASDACLHWGN